jgi:hypothetical protein
MDATVLVLAIALLILAVALVVMAFKNPAPTVVIVPDYRDKQIQDLTARTGAVAEKLTKAVQNAQPKP